MKIAFPIQEDQGLDSRVFGHFGSATGFIIVDDQNRAFDLVSNADADHAHGQCQPLKALAGRPVDAVVVGGIGGGAMKKLGASGIRSFRAVEGTVAENLELFMSGKLPEFTPLHVCGGHGAEGDGACAHHKRRDDAAN